MHTVWIQQCIENHLNCRQIYSSVRLLNISGRDPFLDNGVNPNTLYSALSHHWGTRPALTTTISTLAERCHKIQMAEIPKPLEMRLKFQRDWAFITYGLILYASSRTLYKSTSHIRHDYIS